LTCEAVVLNCGRSFLSVGLGEIDCNHTYYSDKLRVTTLTGCDLQSCPVDCEYLDWTSWSVCGARCGAGTQNRTRPTIPPIQGGKACLSALTFESQPCTNGTCAPPPTPIPTIGDKNESKGEPFVSDSNRLTPGTIAAIVLGSIAVVVLAATALWVAVLQPRLDATNALGSEGTSYEQM